MKFYITIIEFSFVWLQIQGNWCFLILI